MITTAIINLLYVVIWTFVLPLRILPDVSPQNELISAISTASGYIAPFNNLLPVGTLLTIFGLFVGFEIAYFAYKLINWLIRKIPTVN